MSRNKLDYLNTHYSNTRHAYQRLYSVVRSYRNGFSSWGKDEYGRDTQISLLQAIESLPESDCSDAAVEAVFWAIWSRSEDDGLILNRLYGPSADKWFNYLTTGSVHN